MKARLILNDAPYGSELTQWTAWADQVLVF